MSCNLATVQTDACASGVGKLNSEITLLRVIAQLQADYVNAVNPSLDTSPAAILARACTSGIGKETDPVTLLKYTAQLLCDQAA